VACAIFVAEMLKQNQELIDDLVAFLDEFLRGGGFVAGGGVIELVAEMSEA